MKLDTYIDHMRAAEAKFRLASAVRLAVTMERQPLDLPVKWSHGKHTVDHSEIALTQQEADLAAWGLEQDATFTMVSVALSAIKNTFENPKANDNLQVVNAYQIARIIRNSYSHNPSNPIWHIDKDCKSRKFEIEEIICLDCRSLDGQQFDWRHYGGPLALLRFSQFIRYELLDTKFHV